MSDNKVSEKAIWEGTITPDDDTPSLGSQMQTQPQMMFCYKCNNVIPGDSKYCPRCQIKLYVTCPKCGVEYSSQYSNCNQCGTNREEYLQMQRRETERKEAIERENRRRQEILEIEKRERERQEALDRQRHEDYRRKQEERYDRQKEQIINSKEYQSTYSILKESLKSWRRKHIIIIVLPIIIFAIICVLAASQDEDSLLFLGILVSFALSFSFVFTISNMFDVEKREKYIQQYIYKKGCNYNKYILAYVVKQMRNDFYKYTYDVLDNLSQWCIDAYGKQKRMSSFD